MHVFKLESHFPLSLIYFEHLLFEAEKRQLAERLEVEKREHVARMKADLDAEMAKKAVEAQSHAEKQAMEARKAAAEEHAGRANQLLETKVSNLKEEHRKELEDREAQVTSREKEAAAREKRELAERLEGEKQELAKNSFTK